MQHWYIHTFEMYMYIRKCMCACVYRVDKGVSEKAEQRIIENWKLKKIKQQEF